MSASQTARAHLEALVRKSRVPGIQYLVVGPERTVFEYAAGWADIGGRRKLTSTTRMMAYSMSKPITAAAVLHLVAAGKVGLDDPVERWLDFQPYGPEVTVRHLLSHTSGIPSPIPLRWVHLSRFHESFDERAALERVLADHPRLLAPPGRQYRYSNIGYWLLGSVVEASSGEPFPSYVSGHLLRPLGITPPELGYGDVKDREQAAGYLEKYSLMNLLKRLVIDRALIGKYEGRWLRIADHRVDGAAFGGLTGNCRGFGTFLQDQLRPDSALFDRDTKALFYTPQRTSEGRELPMTLGWHIDERAGLRFFYKEGGGGGFHSLMRLYPSVGVATVVMTNATGFRVGRLLDRIDPGFLS